MAAYAIRMHRAGPARLVAAAVVLLALAAGVLFSAGSDHHRHGHHPAPGLAVVGHVSLPHVHTDDSGHGHRTGETPAHGHEHGNEWTPNLSPRARLDGDAPLVSTFIGHVSPAGPRRPAPHTIVAVGDADLILLGVLRV
jgi:hypothetical protein